MRKVFRLFLMVVMLPALAATFASAQFWMGPEGEPITVDTSLIESTPTLADLPAARAHVLSAGEISGNLWMVTDEIPGPAKSVEVTITRNGQVAAEATTDAAGQFSANLESGVYSVVAKSDSAIAVFGIQVTDLQGRASSFDAVMVTPEVKVTESLLRSHKQTSDRKAIEDIVAGEGLNVVSLNAQGHLQGQLTSLVETGADGLQGMDVFLLSGDELVSEAIADQAGNFQFDDVTAGVYDLVASGDAGVLALRINVVEGSFDTSSAAPFIATFPIAPQIIQGPTEFIYDTPVFEDRDRLGYIVGDSSVGGAFGSGGGYVVGGGGGGGAGGAILGGGGGGLRRLLLLGGIGAGIAIPVALSGGSDTTTPTPVSPNQ